MMRTAIATGLVLVLVAACGTAAERVAFGTRHEVVLERRPGTAVLALGGYFEAPQRHFATRRLVVTVNDTLVTSAHLLSPRTYYMPRHPGSDAHDRVHVDSGGIQFPFTHRSGGLADYEWSNRPEYDKWVKQYNNLPQTLHIHLAGLVDPEARSVTVTLYNTLERPAWMGGKGVKPPFVITELALHAARPEHDDFGPYVVPVWSFLDAHPWARKMALDVLQAAGTSAGTKGQIHAQFGMLNLMKGHSAAATACFRSAAAQGNTFPEYNEICFRLLRHTGAGPVPSLEVTEDGPGRWAALYNDLVAVQNGGTVARLHALYRHAEASAPLPAAWHPAWEEDATAWRPIEEQIKGPAPEAGMAANEFALLYDKDSLIVLARGPATPLQVRDVPGTDRPAWEFNCFELFLAPAADFTRYYELNVTAANGRFDQRSLWHGVPDPGVEFDGAWQSRTTVQEGLLRVEYRIPWSDFGLPGPPPANALWAGNVVRVQSTLDAEGQAVAREFSAGKLLWRYFHRIQDGLLLRFAGPKG